MQGWQKLRRLILLIIIGSSFAILLLGQSYWVADQFLHEFYELMGLVLIIVCIVGRTWCSLYIGGRKKQELVEIGPYSIMRNPLYSFSFLGAFGIGLQFGALMTGILAFIIAYGVFRFIVIREEEFLLKQFGGVYEDYLARVPRFWPNISLWTSPEQIEVQPKLVWRTFTDAMVFLVSIPLLETVERFQNIGAIPTYFFLY